MFPFQSWFVADTWRALRQVDLLVENVDQFPLIRQFITVNYRSPYAYRVLETGIVDVTGLLEEHVSLLSL